MSLTITRKAQYCKECIFQSQDAWDAVDVWDNMSCLLFKQELKVEDDCEDDGSCQYRAVACKQCDIVYGNME